MKIQVELLLSQCDDSDDGDSDSAVLLPCSEKCVIRASACSLQRLADLHFRSPKSTSVKVACNVDRSNNIFLKVDNLVSGPTV